MYLEHLVWSAAAAVITGMAFSRMTGRDPSWIIIAVSLVPDMSRLLDLAQEPFFPAPVIHIGHGALHTLAALALFSALFPLALRFCGLRYTDALICTVLGYAAHFAEDALVYPSSYAFFWPVSSMKPGIGILDGTPHLLGVANSTVLVAGLGLLAGAVALRTLVEGPGWWRVFLRGGREERLPSA